MAQGPLVTTAWLAAHLGDPDLVVIDATWFMPDAGRDARAEYAERHIPGAVFFSIDEVCDHVSGLPHMLSSPAEFAVAARRLGVHTASRIVAYDAHGLFSAPRVWWNFRVMGHGATGVLDGGLPRWIAEGRPIETGWREAAHGGFKARLNASLVRDLEAVRDDVRSGREQLVDARSAGRFTGAAPEPRADLRAGHMPGARNVPWSGLVSADGGLRPADDLRAAFLSAGVDLAAPITTTCGSGITAALLALALATLGRDDVAVYDGSWAEWGGRADTPAVTGAGEAEATRVIRSGRPSDPFSRTVGPPIEKGSTVLMADAASLYDERQVTYGRGGLATHDALTAALAELESAAVARLFPSGLAAMTGAMLAVLKAGDEVLVTDAVYKPTRRFCDRVLTRFGVGVRYYAPRTPPDTLMAMAGPATRLIVLESPGSLTLEMQDVPAIARLARARGLLTLMDNTWAAGLYFKPLAHGVDLSVQALTKYAAGHSDVFMGCASARDPGLAKALDHAIWDFGWAVSPDDAYQVLRGLRTLPTRMARHQASGLAVAAWLRGQPQIHEVLHPALPCSPDHDLWRRDYAGAAGLFAAVFKPRSVRAVHAFLDALTLFGLGFSWGGFESLALDCDPQFAVRAERPAFAGPVVRLNIGLEDPQDLIADLRRGLEAMDRSSAV